jgi:predicted  nucleic acid-binding Zn-ribbon protein
MTLDHGDRILAWLDGQDHASTLLAQQAAAEGAITVLTAEIAKLATEMTSLQLAVATATSRQATAVAELASAKQLMAQHQADLDTLKTTENSLVASSKLFANSAIDPAVEALRQEMQSRSSTTGQRQAMVDAAAEQVKQSSDEVAKLQASIEQLAKSRGEAEVRLAASNEELSRSREATVTHERVLAEKWNSVGESHVRFASAAMMRPLTPEQLCWSTLRITGQLEAYVQAEMTELAKESPLAADADAATVAKRRQQATRRAFDKLRGNADLFVNLYGSGADRTEDEFFASADQALFTANAGSIFAWAGPAYNNPTQQAITATEPRQVAHSLYWGLLCRQPTDGEVALIEQQLTAAGDQRNVVIQEMAWGILAGAEFRFRH